MPHGLVAVKAIDIIEPPDYCPLIRGRGDFNAPPSENVAGASGVCDPSASAV